MRTERELPGRHRDTQDVPDRRETPHGTLYRPRSAWIQFPLLIAAFLGSIGGGQSLGFALGGVSDNAELFLSIVFILILICGYSLWMARLQALAFDLIGRSLLKVLFVLIIRRKKPENAEDLIPTAEKLEKVAVRAQQASSSFWIVSLPIGAIGGAAAMLIDAPATVMTRAFAVALGCVVWGFVLAFLARRGWLPILEDE